MTTLPRSNSLQNWDARQAARPIGPSSLWNGTRIGRMKQNALSQEPKLRALEQPNEKQAVCAEADRLSLLYSGS